MHKVLLIILLCWLTSAIAAKAQLIVDGFNINNLTIQYIELIGYNRSNLEASVWIDFGRGYDGSKAGEFLKPVNDREGVRFSSVVEALNYLYKNGWELITVYVPSPTAYHHYVLRRRSQVAR